MSKVSELTREIENVEWRIKYKTEDLLAIGEKVGKRASTGNIEMVIRFSKEVVQLSKDLAAAKKQLTALKKALKAAKVEEVKADDTLQPVRDFLEYVFEKDMDYWKALKKELVERYNGRVMPALKDGWSQSSIDIAKLTKSDAEELFKRDLEARLVKIMADIHEKAGDEISEVNLRRNPNHGLDGYIVGNKGTIRFHTILAGGYNIQRLHYRTLIK